MNPTLLFTICTALMRCDTEMNDCLRRAYDSPEFYVCLHLYDPRKMHDCVNRITRRCEDAYHECRRPSEIAAPEMIRKCEEKK